jgi:hypothetical protein
MDLDRMTIILDAMGGDKVAQSMQQVSNSTKATANVVVAESNRMQRTYTDYNRFLASTHANATKAAAIAARKVADETRAAALAMEDSRPFTALEKMRFAWNDTAHAAKGLGKEAKDVFGDMASQSRSWGPQGMLRGLMMGVGIGSGAQVVTMMMQEWVTLWNANAVAAKEFKKELIEMNKVFGELHQNQRDRFVGLNKLPSDQAALWRIELEKSKRETGNISNDIARITRDLAALGKMNPAEVALGAASPAMQRAAALTGGVSPVVKAKRAVAESGIDFAKYNPDGELWMTANEYAEKMNAEVERLMDLMPGLTAETNKYVDKVKEAEAAVAALGMTDAQRMRASLEAKILEGNRLFMLEVEAGRKKTALAKEADIKDSAFRRAALEAKILEGNKMFMYEVNQERKRAEATKSFGKTMEGFQFDTRGRGMGIEDEYKNEMDDLAKHHRKRKALIESAYTETAYKSIEMEQMKNAKLLEADQAYIIQTNALSQAHRIQQMQAQMNTVAMAGSLAEQMGAMMEEGSAAAKAMFIFSKLMAAAEVIINYQVAAAKGFGQMGPILGVPAAAMMQGMMVASLSMIAAQTIASFDGGGSTGPGSRSGGMDGKGGFLAMMHPNETVIDHTKGGSAEPSVIVNNTYNITTGVTRRELKPILEQNRRLTVAEINEKRTRGR